MDAPGLVDGWAHDATHPSRRSSNSALSELAGGASVLASRRGAGARPSRRSSSSALPELVDGASSFASGAATASRRPGPCTVSALALELAVNHDIPLLAIARHF